MLTSARSVLYLVSVFLFVPLANAQVISVGDDTSTPVEGAGHDYIRMLAETVNPANGSLSLRIQASPAKGRGITLPFSFNYDSNGVNHITPQGIYISALSDQTYVSQGGWAYSVPLITASSWSSSVNTNNSTVTCYFSSGYTFQDPSGGRHNLGLAAASWASNGQYICSNPTINGGDQQFGASLVTTANAGNDNPPVQVTDADGTVYYFSDPERYAIGILRGSLADYVEDRNGNKILIAPGSAVGSFTETDTAGRHAVTSTGMGPSGSTNTITVAGMTFKVSWTTTHPNYSIPYRFVYSVQGDSCTTPPTITTSETTVSSIILPNQQQYKFYYGDNNPNGYSNPYGLLSEIDYPTGAWVRYTWKLSDTYSEALVTDGQGPSFTNPMGCQSEIKTPVIATRSVGLSGSSTPILTQTFSYITTWNAATGGAGPTWSTKQTKATTVDNVRGLTSLTTYTYSSYSLPLPSNNPYIPDFVASQIPVESSVQYYSWGNTSVATQTVNKTWYDQYDLKAQQTILQDVSPSQSSQVTYCYVPSDQNSPCLPSSTLAQLAERDDYDFGATNPSRKTITTYASFPTTPIGGVIKDRAAAVITTDGSGNRYSEIDYTYDAYAGGIGSASATNHDDANFPTTYTARGNVTTKTQKCFVGSTTCTNSITTYSYDDTGQVSSMTDPCGNGACSDMPTGSSHTTHYYYTDNYTTLSGGSNVKYTPSTNTNTYLTQITNPKGQIDTFSYDYYGGQLTAFRNQNDINAGRPGTTYIYNDALLRVTEGTHPDGGQTTYSYNDSVPSATRTTVIDNTVSPTWATSTTSVMDGLGRTIHLELTTDPQGADSTDTTYDGFGRVWKKSNPHRSSTSPTDGIATYIYDSLGRVCLTVPQDIVAVPTTCPTSPPLGDVFTSYTGNCTTVTDEAGKARKSCVDGLGRVTQLFEDPNSLNYETDYTYDALNNLLSVTQKGGTTSTGWRTRSFVYDSLSRLTSAQNPESGTIRYSYDANDNVISKVAPLPNQTGTSTVTTSYKYDVLNRLVSKTYTDSTPPVQYGYDGSALSGCTTAPPSLTDPERIGPRTAMCDGSGATSWSHDQMGRVVSETRTIKGSSAVTKSTSYVYNVDGSVNELTYGSGTTLNYAYDQAQHQDWLGDLINNINYVDNSTFAPPGLMTLYSGGDNPGFSGITRTINYNNRLQPTTVSAKTSASTILSLSYAYGPTGQNNGNVSAITNILDGSRTETFGYDSLNRIAHAYATNWGELYTTDAWSNMTAINSYQGKSYEGLNCGPANTKNQLNTCYGYDSAGNLDNKGSTTYTYDGENRLTSTAGWTYVYDGDGHRVRKASGTTGTLYWPDTSGQVLGESDLTGKPQSDYIFFNGQRIARVDVASVTVHYYFSNHLGSHTVVTNATGTCEQDIDYYPYGNEQKDYCPKVAQHYKFTRKERDTESGLDNFGARYNASSMGRFMTPDPSTNLVLRAVNPQRWNMYAYAINNPTSYVDHDGRDAAAVNFSGMVGGLGHEGLLVINKDGTATYVRFGPEDHSLGNLGGASAPGEVQTYNNIPAVQFGSNGLPTDASVTAVAAAVAQDEGVDPSTVRINYFQTGSTDTAMLNDWVQIQQEHSQNGQGRYGHYCVTSNNCATFTATGLVAGGAITAEQARGLSIDPNRMFQQLSRLANDNFDLLQMQVKQPEKACVTTYGPNGPDTHCE